MLCLEVSTLISKYPDMKDDCPGPLLATQGGTYQDMKSTITEALEQGLMAGNPSYAPIFKGIIAQSERGVTSQVA